MPSIYRLTRGWVERLAGGTYVYNSFPQISLMVGRSPYGGWHVLWRANGYMEGWRVGKPRLERPNVNR